MSAYRDPVPMIQEPDPFPASSVPEMVLTYAAARRVAFAAKRLVSTARAADVAREVFPEARELNQKTARAVERAFESLADAVDAWVKAGAKR